MRPSYMLLLLAFVCTGFGAALARENFFAAGSLGIVAVAIFADVYMHYRRDAPAARRWRTYRRELLEQLTAEYKERAWKQYQSNSEPVVGKSGQGFDVTRLELDARREAEREVLERLGPPV